MIGGSPPLLFAEHPALLLDPSNNPLDGCGEVVKRHLFGIAPGRSNGSLVNQVCKIGASKACRQAGDLVQVDILASLDLLDVNAEDGQPPRFVGAVNQHLSIESPSPKQGGVQNFRSICCRQQNNAGTRIETIELGQQLVECLFLLVMAAENTSNPATTKRVQFVDENDAWRGLSCLLKKVPHTRCADADKQLDKFRPGN